MNKADKKILKNISTILEGQRSVLENLECTLENRELDIKEKNTNEARILHAEVYKIWNHQNTLSEMIHEINRLV